MEKIDKKILVSDLTIILKFVNASPQFIERIIACIEALPTTTDEWVSVETPPKESGRYWCYVKELNDLGNSYFQWNCYYDARVNDWTDNFTPYTVTHWTNLLPQPPTK